MGTCRCRPVSWSSVTGPGRRAAGKRDDADGTGECVAELPTFHGELVDGPDEGGDVNPELGEFLVLALDRLLEPGDGGTEALDSARCCAARPSPAPSPRSPRSRFGRGPAAPPPETAQRASTSLPRPTSWRTPPVPGPTSRGRPGPGSPARTAASARNPQVPLDRINPRLASRPQEREQQRDVGRVVPPRLRRVTPERRGLNIQAQRESTR
jgi:hypothetical protein